LGAKGIGESGTVGAAPAVQNAVVDALAHLGVRHVDMPCTPERVWAAIVEAAATTATATTGMAATVEARGAGTRPTAQHYLDDASPRPWATGGRTGRRISPWP